MVFPLYFQGDFPFIEDDELPEVKGFSERNIGYMIRFALEYGVSPILQQPVAKLDGTGNQGLKMPQAVAQSPETKEISIMQRLAAQIPWGHNILLLEKIKDLPTRLWYMQQTIGLILCQTKDRILAEYALRDIHKPIGISDYELTRALPGNLKSSLPTVEEIEMELGGDWE